MNSHLLHQLLQIFNPNMKTHFGFEFLPKTHILILLISLFINAHSQPDPVDTQVMLSLKKSLNPPSLDWSDPNPCKWAHVVCSDENRVTRIQIGHQNIQGTLPTNLSNLTRLERLELQWNSISGPLPTLNGLNMLQVLMISNNMFTSIPVDFFVGLTSLQAVEMDNNPFTKWVIPESLKDASTLQNFSAVNVNITGKIPGFFGPDVFPGLVNLHLAINDLDGELPSGLSGSQLESFWVNGNRLSGKVDILQNMTFLKEVWLHSNAFSGCLPDLSGLEHLEVLSLRDNSFTGIVPDSLVGLESLKSVNLTNNMFQGPMPKFRDSVSVDMIKGSNNFCLPEPGECDARVNTLLLIAKGMDYSVKFANNWKGNDPCADWIGITCNNDNITIVNFQKMGLTGTISPAFSDLKTLQRIVLANNNLTGTIPEELTTLPSLTQLDLENNNLYGKVPSFKSNLNVNVNGNPDIGKERSSSTDSSSSGTNSTDSNGVSLNGKKKSKNWIGVVLISILGGVFVMFFIGVLAFCLHKKKQKKLSQVQSPHAIVIHPRNSGSDNESVKITVAGSSVSVGALSETHTIPTAEGDNIQMVEAGNMVISIQVLRTVTNNFAKENILGQGGFGTVYKGELHDGTKIAVKRMECGVITGKGLAEFTSEIAVLTKVRHRNLVALLGYCLDGNEKLLVYEYMPQGTLSRYLFNWPEEGLNPLEWTRRLAIALDVARGVEYLHGLAHQSFIHRDLKPSNILLGDDMRAKVGDFGLVRLAPEGKGSVETRIAGTFGYLAPEYAITGRVTTKVDVFSFGVILMELITGRKALDESQPEESMHLVTWFRRIHLNKDTFRKSIDQALDVTEENIASIIKAAELAGHCCAREPYQRPDMSHAVNVLSSLVEMWKPSDQSCDDMYGIDLDLSLPQALKKWQAFEGGNNSHTMDGSSSSFLPSLDNTQTSIPNRPYGFAESFGISDGR